MPRKSRTMDVRARLQFNSTQEGDCWIWKGKTTGKTKSYGEIWYQGKGVRIGRLICHLYHGADLNDNSWTANHTRECTSSLCWNPKHLYVGTQSQNVQDQIAKGTFKNGSRNLNGGKDFNKEEWMKSRHGEK